MGRSIRLTCDKCKESYDLNIGQGIADNNINRVLGHFNGSTADLLSEKISLLSNEGYWNYRSMIGYCGSCKSYVAIPTVTIFDNGKEYVTAGKCGCGGNCELIDDNDEARMKDIKCPKCNSPMIVEMAGMWD